MRKMLMLLIVLFPVFENSAIAEERTHAGKVIVGSSSEYTYSDSSESARQTLRFSLGGYTAPNRTGYTLGYYVNPDLQIELEKRTVYGDSVEGGEFDWTRHEDAFGLNGNFFFKNAWMISFGILERNGTFTERLYYTSDWSPAYDLELRRKDIAVRLKISSQWQWSIFYCGFDWISYEHQVTILSKSVTGIPINGNPINQERISQANQDAGKILKSDVPTIAFRMGFAF